MQLKAGERKWLAAVIACGGVAGPVLLMLGLSRMAAAPASLLLNAEAVFTALLAWFAFRENVNHSGNINLTNLPDDELDRQIAQLSGH